MYRSIYPYCNSNPGFLAFNIGDVFNLIEQVDGFWWSVINETGQHGLVPATYLEVNSVTEEDVLCSLDRSIESISKAQANRRGPLNEEERRILQKLISHCEMVSSGNSLWNKADISVLSAVNRISQQPKRQAPKAPLSKARIGKSMKQHSAPAPPGAQLLRSKSLGSCLSQKSSFDEGTSSKIYNIVVNNHSTQLPVSPSSPTGSNSCTNSPKANISNNETSKNAEVAKITSGENFWVFVEKGNSTSSPDSVDSSSPSSQQTNKVTNIGLTEICGKNLTISKSINTNGSIVANVQATNFTVKSTAEQNKQRSGISSTKTDRAPAPPVRRASTKAVINKGTIDRTLTGEKEYGLQSSLCTTSLNSFNNTLEASSAPDLSMSSIKSFQCSTNVEKDIDVSDGVGKYLIDIVCSRCKLGFDKSLATIRVVLDTLGEEVPVIKDVTDKICNQIVDDKLVVQRGVLAHEDATKLQNILDKLTEHKEDSQQRNWAVHEDFEVIKDLLDELVQIMGEIDPSIACSVLRLDDYQYINDLVIYYQMEHRPTLRVTLLHAFGCFCELGTEFIMQLLCSVLPTELALDMMQDQKDMLKFLTSCLMLTMVFSTGESIPYNHYLQFNGTFINFILDTIEDPPDADVEDQVPDALIGVLLAFNQHFKSPKDNVVLQCFSKRTLFRTLSEKILLLVNREKDPVAIFNFIHPCPDSVMKFLIDLFASSKTSGILFTNDLMVLIDIILRQIMDRPVKDKVRTEYLSLFHSILNTTNYSEHRHHAADFKRCFDDILLNREHESEVDLYIVTEITKRCSELF